MKTIVTLLIVLVAATAPGQIVIPPGTKVQQPGQRVVHPPNISGRGCGAVAPGMCVDSITVRAAGPLLTLSDTASNRDAYIRSRQGDVALGFFIGDLVAYQDAVFLTPNGNLGIGTDKGSHRLSITGGPAWTNASWKGAVELENGAAVAWKANNAGLSFGIGHTNDGLYFFHTTSGPGTSGAEAQYDLRIKDDGAVSVKALDLEGADVAENFPVNSSLQPGIIVSIDEAHPGSLTISDRAFDHRVAGIVSGAGGINPGVVMGRATSTGASPIALTGRVYCWADASSGAINPGDFLTTSPTPGHAMKVKTYAEAQGAIIGKAMTSLSNGRGLVLVLVTLQ